MNDFDQAERLKKLADLIEKRDRQVSGLLGVAVGLAATQTEVMKLMKELGINPVRDVNGRAA